MDSYEIRKEDNIDLWLGAKCADFGMMHKMAGMEGDKDAKEEMMMQMMLQEMSEKTGWPAASLM